MQNETETRLSRIHMAHHSNVDIAHFGWTDVLSAHSASSLLSEMELCERVLSIGDA